MKTYQDFEAVQKLGNDAALLDFVTNAVAEHKASQAMRDAETGERYYRSENDISSYKRYMVNQDGHKVEDVYSPNSRLCSNWHSYFVNQAVQYLLGNGVSFNSEATREKLGKDFDQRMSQLATIAKNEGTGYAFYNNGHLEIFPLVQFKALPDEKTSAVRAGVRFWSIEGKDTEYYTLYTEQGYRNAERKQGAAAEWVEEMQPYKTIVSRSAALGEQVEGYENYSRFPIVPLYNPGKQTELKGKKNTIDAVDILKSNFVNSGIVGNTVYWVVTGADGEDDKALEEFIEKIQNIHVYDAADDQTVTPHTVEAPYLSTQAALEMLEKTLFNDYMGLNVESIRAGNITATQIEAAYEPLNQKTDLFEMQVTECINQLLDVAGLDDEPSYERSMIVNTSERIENLLACADLLGTEFVIKRLCTVLGCPDEAAEIIENRKVEEARRFEPVEQEGEENDYRVDV